jgi:hypothetical protein
MLETYKGFEIRHNDYAFLREDQFVATSPDYDVDCDEDGFFVCSGIALYSDSLEDLKAQIDGYIDASDETPEKPQIDIDG